MKQVSWFEKPEVAKILVRALLGFCALSVVLQYLLTDIGKKGHFNEPGWIPSYAVMGFAACIGLIAVARILGFVIRRKEGYWGVEESDKLPDDIDESIR